MDRKCQLLAIALGRGLDLLEKPAIVVLERKLQERLFSLNGGEGLEDLALFEWPLDGRHGFCSATLRL